MYSIVSRFGRGVNWRGSYVCIYVRLCAYIYSVSLQNGVIALFKAVFVMKSLLMRFSIIVSCIVAVWFYIHFCFNLC